MYLTTSRRYINLLLLTHTPPLPPPPPPPHIKSPPILILSNREEGQREWQCSNYSSSIPYVLDTIPAVTEPVALDPLPPPHPLPLHIKMFPLLIPSNCEKGQREWQHSNFTNSYLSDRYILDTIAAVTQPVALHPLVRFISTLCGDTSDLGDRSKVHLRRKQRITNQISVSWDKQEEHKYYTVWIYCHILVFQRKKPVFRHKKIVWI